MRFHFQLKLLLNPSQQGFALFPTLMYIFGPPFGGSFVAYGRVGGWLVKSFHPTTLPSH
jgi:hypothetical protein